MIQARCGSTRLPSKVIKDLCGKPQLQRVIERVQMSKIVDEVIVITSIDRINLPILKLCSELGIRVGVGSEDDVLDRYYQTARLLRPEYIIRVTGDCPLFDGELLDSAIKKMKKDTDYCAMLDEDFADGLDFEIIKYDCLEKAWKEAVHSYEREHVTQYIIHHPDLFKIQSFKSPIGNFGKYRWTVDEQEDFELVEQIYKFFLQEKKKNEFSYKEILAYLKDNPQLVEINSKYTRNEGLAKSISEDYIVDLPR